MPINRGVENKIWSFHTIEQYSAIKRNKVLLHYMQYTYIYNMNGLSKHCKLKKEDAKHS